MRWSRPMVVAGAAGVVVLLVVSFQITGDSGETGFADFGQPSDCLTTPNAWDEQVRASLVEGATSTNDGKTPLNEGPDGLAYAAYIVRPDDGVRAGEGYAVVEAAHIVVVASDGAGFFAVGEPAHRSTQLPHAEDRPGVDPLALEAAARATARCIDPRLIRHDGTTFEIR